MIENKLRIGNFTSSDIHALTTSGKEKGSFGKLALTYIEEKNMERLLGRSLDTETSSKALDWGKVLEGRAFELLGLEYSLQSDVTLQHPKYPFWVGSPDGIKHAKQNAVIDIKCPFTLKSYCIFAECKTIEEVVNNHPDGDKYHKQLVSNAAILGLKNAELIIHMPYKSELYEVRKMAQYVDPKKYYWIANSEDNQLPYLPDGGYYQNFHKIHFEIPQSDFDFLEERVKLAGEKLIQQPIY